MKATAAWLASTGGEFSAGAGRGGCAPLTHYTVNYREWGEGRPLVLVPGLAGGMELLGPLAKLLAQNYRVISYQLRGEDDCFALRRRFDFTDLVGDLAEFVDWHCLERPILMGVSFGGALALEFAAKYPSRISHLVVQGVGASFERGLIHEVAGTVLSRFPLPADNPFINQFFNLLFGGKQKGPVVDFVTRQCWQTDQSMMAHRFQMVEQFNVGRNLERIRVPSLVLTGDRDLLVSKKSLAALVDGLPNAKSVPVPNSGHLAFVTQPERVASEVRRFLK